jgi:hypothetical protein
VAALVPAQPRQHCRASLSIQRSVAWTAGNRWDVVRLGAPTYHPGRATSAARIAMGFAASNARHTGRTDGIGSAPPVLAVSSGMAGSHLLARPASDGARKRDDVRTGLHIATECYNDERGCPRPSADPQPGTKSHVLPSVQEERPG